MTTDEGQKQKRVRLKFCGGCNPEYDRLALADRIKKMIAAADNAVLSNDDDPDLVIAICGCPTCCAEVDGFGEAQVIKISSPEDLEKIRL